MKQTVIFVVEDGNDYIACNDLRCAQQLARQWCEAYMEDYDDVYERERMEIDDSDFERVSVVMDDWSLYDVRIRTVDYLEV